MLMSSIFNNEGIDYCVVGALPCFLQAGLQLFRYHDDIDIMINENDVEKVKNIMEAYGYSFSDMRFPNLEEFREMKKNWPPHLVMAQNPYNDFHIGFFTFRRENDNSMTTTEYMPREFNGEMFVDRMERHFSQYGTSLRYDNNLNLDGINIRVCSIEDVYNLKGYTRRPKDITDMELLDPFVDKEKLKELRRNTNTRQIVKNISKEEEMVM